MGKRTGKSLKSQTLPSSPSHSFSSSSSSDFEFTITVSPRQASKSLCPADELFYKGQLLPLHLSPRISMVRTLLLASSSISSSSDTNSTTASRDSTGSSTSTDSHSSFFNSDSVFLADCDSSRPSSVTEDDEFRGRFVVNNSSNRQNPVNIKKNKYFSLSRFSSVFRKEQPTKNIQEAENASGSQVKKISVSAKEVIRKYLKKVKPLYGKMSQRNQPAQDQSTKMDRSVKEEKDKERVSSSAVSHSFSGNLKFPRKRTCISSCPSSIRSSPSHSGILSCRTGPSGMNNPSKIARSYPDASSMEELHSAIQGAIAHCKNSMIQNKAMLS